MAGPSNTRTLFFLLLHLQNLHSHFHCAPSFLSTTPHSALSRKRVVKTLSLILHPNFDSPLPLVTNTTTGQAAGHNDMAQVTYSHHNIQRRKRRRFLSIFILLDSRWLWKHLSRRRRRLIVLLPSDALPTTTIILLRFLEHKSHIMCVIATLHNK